MAQFAVEDKGWLRTLLAHPETWQQLPLEDVMIPMLENYKSADPELRDELSFTLVASLMNAPQMTEQMVARLVRRALDADHLFYRIGERGKDSVFMRSFSVLTIPLVMEWYEDRGSLSSELFGDMVGAVERYALAEQDWRGYVASKGWAHGAAHLADALGALGSWSGASEAQLDTILRLVHHVATLSTPLAHTEDDRLAMAVFQMLEAHPRCEAPFRRWLDGFQLKPSQNDGEETIRGANANHFLRALYYRFTQSAPQSDWLWPLLEALRRFDIYHQQS